MAWTFLLQIGLAQQKSITPSPAGASAKVGATTRAVVIGVSDYQDPAISDLRFADRDAMAFAGWLQSEAGGNLTTDHIKLLTNEQAKIGNIVAALTWLLDECMPGERAILYFSGHGDVEKATMFQRGYLLAYDMPPTNYMAGGINVRDIQDVVSTLSNRGVQVTMITDACRAGKLAGSETGGAQATTATLLQQFANEIKVLSCQPDEFSIEGEQWGGGRGAFSYHLIEGLYGLADQNGDAQVSLLEIGNYLQSIVPKETAPQSQIPMTVGNPKARLASVNPQMLEALKNRKSLQPLVFSSLEQKGLEEMVLAKADSSIRETYAAFLSAIKQGNLMPSDTGGKCADDYFRILIIEPELAQLHGLMKRNFAAALQNESQVVTNKLLQTDPFVVSDAWSRPFVFDHIPAYLERAAEILGTEHFFYKRLKAKQLFFEAKACLPDRFPNLTPDSVVQMAARHFEDALRFDSTAAYAHVEYGNLLFYKLYQSENAWQHIEKALELSPNWVYAHYMAGCIYLPRMDNKANLVNQEFHLFRALELDSSFLLPYWTLASIYLSNQEIEKSAFYRGKFIQKLQEFMASEPKRLPVIYHTLLAGALSQTGRLEEAEAELLKVVEITKGQDLTVYQFLGVLYYDMGRNIDMLEVLKKQVELAPFNPQGYYGMERCYLLLGQPQKRVETCEKAVTLLEKDMGENPAYTLIMYLWAELADAYREVGREEESRATYQKLLQKVQDPRNDFEVNMKGRALLWLEGLPAMQQTIDDGFAKFPGEIMIYYQAACLYSMAREEQKALEWLEAALEKGFKDGDLMNIDYDLDNIRHSSGFKALNKKYFPDKVKD